MSLKQQRAFKMVVTGPPGVGKSSLLRRLTDNSFSQSYDVTVGAEFFSKLIYAGENEVVKLQIWDTAGQQTFHSLTKTFYRGAAAIFLVYNITNLSSFQQLNYWYSEAINNCQQDSVFGLIGTQKDKQNQYKTVITKAQSNGRNGGKFYEGQRKYCIRIRDLCKNIRKCVHFISVSDEAHSSQKVEYQIPSEQSNVVIKYFRQQLEKLLMLIYKFIIKQIIC